MILSATLKKESVDGETVRYVDSFGGKHSFLSGAVVLKTADLPDPAPALLRIELSWYQAPPAPEGQGPGSEGGLGGARSGGQAIAQGDYVKVIKSRKGGVQSPPEWLEQYLGRTGGVLRITPSGVNVDLQGEIVWFAYDELERLDMKPANPEPPA